MIYRKYFIQKHNQTINNPYFKTKFIKNTFIQLASFFTPFADICFMPTSGFFHVGMKEAIIWFKQN